MTLFSSFINYITQYAPIFAARLLTALLIFGFAVFGARIVARTVSRLLARDRQTLTLAPVIGSLAKVLITGAGAITALAQVGIDITTVLAGAGVVGLAVGFGAQTLVKDLLSGFFLIFDGVISVGDTVKLDQVEGVVEVVGLRMTQVRALNGRVWYVPNGSINVVGNSSRDWSRAIVDVGVGYATDLTAALQLMKKVGDEYARANPSVVLEPAEAAGAISLDDSSIKLRLALKTSVSAAGPAELELRRRVKEAFEKQGIEIPYPTRTILQGQAK